MSSKKRNYGQFYTTNYSYILQTMEIPTNIDKIIEPFCGYGDMLGFLKKNGQYTVETYDIDPKIDGTTLQDTLVHPPCYKGSFVLTNPPYLARNKCTDKTIYDKYNMNDLYKCFLSELITNQCLGGIVIIPLNFWSSIRKADIDLRRQFLSVYEVSQLNIFEEQVFVDTTYTVCSMQFHIRSSSYNIPIIAMVYPYGAKVEATLTEDNQYMIGGEIYNLPDNPDYTITRLTSKTIDKPSTNILVKCIDDGEHRPISLSMVRDAEVYVDNTPKLSARTYATLVIDPPISLDTQKRLVERFNEYLNLQRKKYNSLFLTNYRESKDIARKRISFDLVYQIVGSLLASGSQKSC